MKLKDIESKLCDCHDNMILGNYEKVNEIILELIGKLTDNNLIDFCENCKIFDKCWGEKSIEKKCEKHKVNLNKGEFRASHEKLSCDEKMANHWFNNYFGEIID
jgi:hypothetical protein